MKENKKSILDEALTEYKTIVEAANQNAMKKLADEFPSKFNDLIEQELKNKNKTTEESYKKIDKEEESENDVVDKKELEMEKEKKKETKKVKEKKVDVVGTAIEETKFNEEFDITELSDDEIESVVDEIDDEDLITIDDIENEISELENTIGSEETDTDGDMLDKLNQMKNTLDSMISDLGGEETTEFEDEFGGEVEFDGEIDSEIDAPSDDIGNDINAEPESEDMLVDDTISDVEIDEILKDFEIEDEVEESLAHTISHSNAKQAGSHNHTNYQKEKNLRYGIRESKTNSHLMEENKKITKKLNEALRYKKSVDKLIEQYRGALEKYRTQLKEMAIFNTNLAHVNNILVNEELALTQEDKIKVIEEFKEIKTITESKNKYKKVVSEMKVTSKKNLSENIEDKVSVSIQPSSKKRLDEVNEKTLYKNNEYYDRMMKTINYMENRGKK